MDFHSPGPLSRSAVFLLLSLGFVSLSISCSPEPAPESEYLYSLKSFTVEGSRLTEGDAYLLIVNPTSGSIPLPSLAQRTSVPEDSRSLESSLDSGAAQGSARGLVISPPSSFLKVQNFSLDAPRTLNTEDIVGTTKTFKLAPGVRTNLSEPSTARLVRTVSTAQGDKKLIIHVANSLWTAETITSTMVEVLADAFLKDGGMDDVYDWSTSLLGEEWGTQERYSNQIPANDTITILISDLAYDPSGSLVGYFYAANNFAYDSSDNPYSNERIMFVLNGNYYAATEDLAPWTADTPNSETTISVLTHEFQHMIQFFQREIVQANGYYDVWLNELMSMALEDVLAEKLGVPGPLGYTSTGGEALPFQANLNNYPDSVWSSRPVGYFEKGPEVSVLRWSASGASALPYYASNSLFGSFLLRKYGGPLLLRNLMNYVASSGLNSTSRSLNALQSVTDQSLHTLLTEFTNELLDSRQVTVGEGLNQGQWIEYVVDTVTYKLASMNLWAYPLAHSRIWQRPLDETGLPLIRTNYFADGAPTQTISAKNKTHKVPAQSWSLYKLRSQAADVTGYSNQVFKLDMSPDLEAQIVYKELAYP